MRSYHAHLASLSPNRSRLQGLHRPIFRSSAIFPVIQTDAVTSRILFMGHWSLSGEAEKLGWVTSLRTLDGTLLTRTTGEIVDARCCCIELRALLKNCGIHPQASFQGSIEVEFFSPTPLDLPFPATILNLYGQYFSTVVDTAQRIYNDAEDYARNTQAFAPETGFDIHATSNREPFFALINGFEATDAQQIELTLFNLWSEKKELKLNLPPLAPYQTFFVYPGRHCDLYSFLKGEVGTAKISFHVKWAYPRLIAGNWQKRPEAAMITHTYYDCSKASQKTDYWHPEQEEYHAATLMVPAPLQKDQQVYLMLYPLFSPSKFVLDIALHDSEGEEIAFFSKVCQIHAPYSTLHRISFKELFSNHHLNLDRPLAARIIARPVEGDIPARLQIGLNIASSKQTLPCNISTNLQPFNPSLENRPQTLRWAPFLGTNWICNSSQHKTYHREAKVDITVYRESDAQTKTDTFTLPPHGFKIVKRSDFASFLGNETGWITATSSNPHILTYYFTEEKGAMIGGNHGF